MASTIVTKNSSTASAVPVSGDLTQGELAVNVTDKRLFTKNSGGTVVELGTNPASLALPNGTTNGVAYLNGSKVVTTGSALTFDGNAQTITHTSGYGLAITRSTKSLTFNGNYAAANTNADINSDLPVSFSLSGSEQMRLTSTGLGIGTSSPGFKLDLKMSSATRTGGFAIRRSTNDNHQLGLWTSGGAMYFDAVTDNGAAPGTTIFRRSGDSGSTFTESMVIDSSGNLGLGVTPSAWQSGRKAMQVGNASINSFANSQNQLGANFYYDGTNNKYISSDFSTVYQQLSGQHQWFTAPSGTAGNAISFTQAMTLDASGNLALGTTSPIYTAAGRGNITVQGSASSVISLGTSASANGYLFFDSNGLDLFNAANTYLRFGTNGSERARIDSSGNLGLGVTPSAWETANSVRALQFNAGSVATYSTNYMWMFQNAYRNSSGNEIYVNSTTASKYQQAFGAHAWYNAGSGTAGNAITFTQAMTLDASGNLMVGTTTATGKASIAGAITATASSALVNPSVGVFGLYTSGPIPNTYVQMPSGGSIDFWKADTSVAARIDSSGNLLVGTTGQPIGTARFVSSASGTTYGGTFVTDTAGYSGLISWNKATSGTIYLAEFATGSSYVARGSITYNGTLVAYNTTSDYRLKTVVGPVAGYSQRIDALEPIEYTWDADGTSSRGFLAHKFQEVYPSSVTGSKDEVDADGNPVYQQMQGSTNEVIADLVAEIKSLRIRLAALEAK